MGSALHVKPDAKPATWSAAWVRVRLVEAFEVDARLPSDRRNRSPNAWPFAVRHDFADIVGWDDARERVWHSWARAQGAYPFEISRMDEAMGWLAILHDHDAERRCLAAWALLTGRSRSVRTFLARRKLSRTTFYRRVEDGSERIAETLRRRGIGVR